MPAAKLRIPLLEGLKILSSSYQKISACTVRKAVNREDKLSRRYRGRDLAKFERSRRYRER